MSERIECSYDTCKEGMSEYAYHEHDKSYIEWSVWEIDEIFYYREAGSDENTRDYNLACISWPCDTDSNEKHQEFDDFFEQSVTGEIGFDKEITQDTVMEYELCSHGHALSNIITNDSECEDPGIDRCLHARHSHQLGDDKGCDSSEY